MMCFPEGWTDPDVGKPGMWQGFPMRAKLRYWATPLASDGKGGRTNRGSLRRDADDLKKGRIRCPQYPYEFPRLAPARKWRKERLKALGNAVVPLQAWPLFQAMALMHEAVFGGRDDNSGGCGDIRSQS